MATFGGNVFTYGGVRRQNQPSATVPVVWAERRSLPTQGLSSSQVAQLGGMTGHLY